MGGYGSGWQGSKKATVEGSLVLTASALLRKKALVPGAQTAGSWGWAYEEEDGPHATVRYEADLRDTDNAWVRLHYRADGEAVDYKVRLVTTKPNYGGHRWWFICPIVRRDGGPPRRVAKLYLPSGSKYFGSREAYALTYSVVPGERKIRPQRRTNLSGRSCGDRATAPRIDPFSLDRLLRFL